jgi:hypothetical protein
MTDVHADTVLSRTRPWSVKVSPLRRAPSRNSRSWVCASLFSLLVLFLIAAAYWYVTASRVVYTNELYFDVGQASHSTDVSAIAGNQHRTLRPIAYGPHARQVQITYRQPKDLARADEADIETFERHCWRTPSDIGLQ